MQKTTAEITIEYIKEHPHIKNCLRKGLINYSSLARLIASDKKITKKTSKEAILVAARRFAAKLKDTQRYEKSIAKVLSTSQIEVKNKIEVVVTAKDIDFAYLHKIQLESQTTHATLFALEGSSYFTFICEKRIAQALVEKLKCIKHTTNLSLIRLRNSKEIEEVPGVVAYLTSLFSENGVNIVEFLSCWTDTLFVIDSRDVAKVFEFLEF